MGYLIDGTPEAHTGLASIAHAIFPPYQAPLLMYDLLLKGGPLMVPIVFGSIVATAVFLERLHALGRSRVLPPSLGVRVREAVAAGDRSLGMAICRKTPGAGATILAAVLEAAGRGHPFIRAHAEDVGRRQLAALERYIGVLGVIASVSPLLGLLGTVTGMISVFQQVVTDGVGDPTLLARGIWEALITTAAGLTVAIPSFLAWRFLLSKVKDISMDLEEETSSLVDLLLFEDINRPDHDGDVPKETVKETAS